MANTADDVLFKPVDIGMIGRCVGKLACRTLLMQLHAPFRQLIQRTSTPMIDCRVSTLIRVS
jgi:hypothetical protein